MKRLILLSIFFLGVGACSNKDIRRPASENTLFGETMDLSYTPLESPLMLEEYLLEHQFTKEDLNLTQSSCRMETEFIASLHFIGKVEVRDLHFQVIRVISNQASPEAARRNTIVPALTKFTFNWPLKDKDIGVVHNWTNNEKNLFGYQHYFQKDGLFIQSNYWADNNSNIARRYLIEVGGTDDLGRVDSIRYEVREGKVGDEWEKMRTTEKYSCFKALG